MIDQNDFVQLDIEMICLQRPKKHENHCSGNLVFNKGCPGFGKAVANVVL